MQPPLLGRGLGRGADLAVTLHGVEKSMFTGIIEETGTVERIKKGTTSIRMTINATTTTRGLKNGDSLAVNGCCLTVVDFKRRKTGGVATFDLLKETWNRTNFSTLIKGSLVNLERSMQADGRFDGHFVTGHVDGVGKITQWKQVGADWLLSIRPPAQLLPHLVLKGSIAVDGISLTVATQKKRTLSIWIIPHTRSVTNLATRKTGDDVNLETDIIGKYVERQFALRDRR